MPTKDVLLGHLEWPSLLRLLPDWHHEHWLYQMQARPGSFDMRQEQPAIGCELRQGQVHTEKRPGNVRLFRLSYRTVAKRHKPLQLLRLPCRHVPISSWNVLMLQMPDRTVCGRHRRFQMLKVQFLCQGQVWNHQRRVQQGLPHLCDNEGHHAWYTRDQHIDSHYRPQHGVHGEESCERLHLQRVSCW